MVKDEESVQRKVSCIHSINFKLPFSRAACEDPMATEIFDCVKFLRLPCELEVRQSKLSNV